MNFTVPIVGDAHFKSDARQPDRVAAVQQILRECFPLRVGCWVIPGDLFDGISDVAARNAWADVIEQMVDRAPVILCYGNHDRDGDLYVFGKIKGQYPVYVVDRPKVLAVPTPVGFTLNVFVLPYPHPAGLVATGTPPAEIVSEARRMLDAVFMDAAATFVHARARREPLLFVGHANVGGSRLSTGQPLIGQEIELDAALMQRLGADCPKILNHIHLPQEIDGAWLTGSVTAMSWGETERKRYLRVRYVLDDGETWDATVESCPLHTPSLVLVDAVYRDGTFTYLPLPSDVPAGSDVRVRVRFTEAERDFFEHGRPQITHAFPHARKLAVDPICEVDRNLRAPAVAAATTLAEKIRAWADASGVPMVEEIEEALAALETQPANDVIAAFTARMEKLKDG